MDEQRRKWSQQLYGIETSDPRLYDLVLNISQLTLDVAVDIICHKIGLKQFQTTPESQQNMEDLSLAAEVKAFLIDLKPDIQVMSQKGMIRVMTNASAAQKLESKMKKVSSLLLLQGVNKQQLSLSI